MDEDHLNEMKTDIEEKQSKSLAEQEITEAVMAIIELAGTHTTSSTTEEEEKAENQETCSNDAIQLEENFEKKTKACSVKEHVKAKEKEINERKDKASAAVSTKTSRNFSLAKKRKRNSKKRNEQAEIEKDNDSAKRRKDDTSDTEYINTKNSESERIKPVLEPSVVPTKRDILEIDLSGGGSLEIAERFKKIMDMFNSFTRNLESFDIPGTAKEFKLGPPAKPRPLGQVTKKEDPCKVTTVKPENLTLAGESIKGKDTKEALLDGSAEDLADERGKAQKDSTSAPLICSESKKTLKPHHTVVHKGPEATQVGSQHWKAQNNDCVINIEEEGAEQAELFPKQKSTTNELPKWRQGLLKSPLKVGVLRKDCATSTYREDSSVTVSCQTSPDQRNRPPFEETTGSIEDKSVDLTAGKALEHTTCTLPIKHPSSRNFFPLADSECRVETFVINSPLNKENRNQQLREEPLTSVSQQTLVKVVESPSILELPVRSQPQPVTDQIYHTLHIDTTSSPTSSVMRRPPLCLRCWRVLTDLVSTICLCLQVNKDCIFCLGFFVIFVVSASFLTAFFYRTLSLNPQFFYPPPTQTLNVVAPPPDPITHYY